MNGCEGMNNKVKIINVLSTKKVFNDCFFFPNGHLQRVCIPFVLIMATKCDSYKVEI